MNLINKNSHLRLKQRKPQASASQRLPEFLDCCATYFSVTGDLGVGVGVGVEVGLIEAGLAEEKQQRK